MLNHSTILLGSRFKRLPYPESIFKDYVYLNFMKSWCICLAKKQKFWNQTIHKSHAMFLFNIKPEKL